jgi:hypothetical protein
VFAKTVSLQVLEQPRAPTRGELLQDIAAFERKLERDHEDRKRKAEEERIRDEHLRRAEAARLQEENERAARVQASKVEDAPRGALGLLKNLANAAPRKDEKQVELARAKASAAAVARLGRDMRSAAQYLAELAREINSIEPSARCFYDYPHLGRLPSVSLFDAWSDSRSHRLGGSEWCTHVMFRYRIQPDAGFSAVLHGDDIARCERELTQMKAEFRKWVEATNDFGEATRAAIAVRGGLLCEMYLRADYEALSVIVAVKNVRRPGTRECRVSAGELAPLPDELGRYALGADDDLEKRMIAVARP